MHRTQQHQSVLLSGGNSSSRSTTIRLFFTCWIIYGLHFATNTVREVYPALTLGDGLSFNVAEYVDLHPDLFAMPDGRAFSNNNPGASIVGAVPYALTRPVIDRIVTQTNENRRAAGEVVAREYESKWPLAREFHRKAYESGLDVKFALGAGVMQAFGMAPLSALAVVVMYQFLSTRLDSPRATLLLAGLYAFATPIFYRTAQLNQNLIVTHCALFAFFLLWQPRDHQMIPRRPAYLLAGLLCGWAIVSDYSGIVVLVVLGSYAWWRRRTLPAGTRVRWDASMFIAGAGVSISVLLLYQWSSFGDPFLPAQFHMPSPQHGHKGMGWPDPVLFWQTLFDFRFGLFVSAPLLILALYAPAWWGNRGLLPRGETWFAVAFILCFLLFCSANSYGYMQFNTGVRHAVPVTPFVFLLAASTLLSIPRVVAVTVGVTGLFWSWCLAMYREVELGWGVLEAPKHILTEGLRLPWLTTLQRLGYVHGPIPLVIVLALSATLISLIWWVQWPRRNMSSCSRATKRNYRRHNRRKN